MAEAALASSTGSPLDAGRAAQLHEMVAMTGDLTQSLRRRLATLGDSDGPSAAAAASALLRLESGVEAMRQRLGAIAAAAAEEGGFWPTLTRPAEPPPKRSCTNTSLQRTASQQRTLSWAPDLTSEVGSEPAERSWTARGDNQPTERSWSASSGRKMSWGPGECL